MSIAKIVFGSRNKTETPQHDLLSVEALEDRVMLSSVEIFAAGATGQENLNLLVDGQVVQTFFDVGGDASTRDFTRFTFETDQPITPGNIGIEFTNDAFDPSIGLDRDLIVDRIVVDGVSVEAEDPTTFSTGVFLDGGLTGPGFFETEVLNVNGVLTFADPEPTGGDFIEFDAAGSTGDELIQLLINGEVVETFGFSLADPGTTQTFTFASDDPGISIEDIRLEFVNDLFDPSTGTDRNVQIFEFRVIDTDIVDGTNLVQRASTSDANVISSGIFLEGVGITEGLGAGGFLAGNGFVEIFDNGLPGIGDSIEFDAFGTTGEELVFVLVDGRPEGIFQLSDPGVTQTFSVTSEDPNISIEDVRLEFVNDLFDPAAGIDRNVQIFEYRVIDGGTGQVTTARTTDANVLNSGIFDGTQITQGFGAGGFLAGEFNGSAFVEISGAVEGPASLPLDPNFQVTPNTTAGAIQGLPAIGPENQVATIGGTEVLVLSDNGVPLSSFGDNGRVDLNELFDLEQLADEAGLLVPDLIVTDLEFFDDGSLLLTGRIEELDSSFTEGFAPPFIAKLTPEGTLDSSFAQQGVLQGTLIQLPTLGEETISQMIPSDALSRLDSGIVVNATIDSSGRIVVFGANRETTGFAGGPFDSIESEPANYVVSRLNSDGTIDSTFGDNGNVFLLGTSLGDFSTGLFSGEPLLVEVSDSGEITIAFTFTNPAEPTEFSSFGPEDQSLAIVRFSDDGSFDQDFADNGFFVRGGFDPGFNSGQIVVRATPDGGVAVGFTNNDLSQFDGVPFFVDGTPALLLLNSNGEVASEVALTPNLLTESGDVVVGDSPFQALFVTTDSLAVDQSGDIVLSYARSASGSDFPDIFVRLSPAGGVEAEFFLESADVDNELVFDSQNRLVVVGQDITRFEFV